ncbi:MAG: hypothetical protein FWF91_02120 [Coriobacteriia bacterium]|nr:hypothetical protein [Coriobacteriia bacterium]
MGFSTVTIIILLIAVVLAAFAAVVVRTLPAATIFLAVTSVFLASALYLFGMQLAAVIELSVSAGLVTAILASAIALLKPADDKPAATEAGRGDASSNAPANAARNSRLMRYLALPIIMLALAVALLILAPDLDSSLIWTDIYSFSPQALLWGERTLDIIALIFVILAGVLGVAALIRRREGEER